MTDLNCFLLSIFGFLTLATGTGLFMNYLTAKWWTEHFVEWFGNSYSFTFNQIGISLGMPFIIVGCLLAFFPSISLCKRLNNRQEANPIRNQRAIELNTLGQEARNLGVKTTNSEQGQNRQVAELQRRLTQLENQLNQQYETRIEVAPSSI